MSRILILTAIFLLINFARSQVYDSYGGQYASAYSGGYSDLGRQYSQTTYYQQPGGRRTQKTEEVVQSPVGTTKVITTQQQSAYGGTRYAGNFGRKKRNVFNFLEKA
jgi:hypothetical protein